MPIDQQIMSRIKPGATIRVFERVREGDKERLSRFEGLVLARKHGSEPGASFTVRATVSGVGVEKVYSLHSTLIEKVEILDTPNKVHRAKLYYVRNLSPREMRQRMATTRETKSAE